MKISIYMLLISVVFMSCNAYQMIIVKSPNTKQNQENGSFVVSNDTLDITYSFAGINGPVNITVLNKLDEPLFIDWSKSSIIMNDQATKYVSAKIAIAGESSGYTFNNHTDINSSSSTFSGEADLPQYIDFIPPKSYIRKQPVKIANNFFKNIPKKDFKKVTLSPKDLGPQSSPIFAEEVEFDKNTSPLVFKSYLTFYTGSNPKQKTEFAYQDNFYISELYKMGTNPNKTNLMEFQNEDRFYLSKKTAFGKTMIGVATVGAIGAVGALDNATPDNN